MQLKKLISLVLATVPLVALGLTACNGQTNTQTAQDTASTSLEPGAHEGHHAADTAMPHDMMHMDLGAADETFDLRFIDAMILHHQGAVEMAEDAANKSQRPEIQQLAQAIIAAQEREIAQMQQWRQAWYPDAAAEPVMYDAQMGHMMPMNDEMRAIMMMNQDLGPADEGYDQRFIDAMVPHHEGALTMAEEALEKSDRPEIQQLAQDILDSQQVEIEQMQQWRQSWYGQS
jgi:uncharacterized protein (DUF305 family)